MAAAPSAIVLASMGPRSFNRGNFMGVGSEVFGCSCFNGAAVFQPRKSLAAVATSGAYSNCFNGAAVFQPRKCFHAGRKEDGRKELQWGRGLSTAEMPGVGVPLSVMSAASMGPRSFNRGNVGNGSHEWGLCHALQWGRGLSTAEIWRSRRFTPPSGRRFNGAAVFQPRKSAAWETRPAGRRGFNGAAVFQPRKFGASAP